MVTKRKVIILKQFDKQSREIFNYIYQNSEQNAQKFKYEIINIITKIQKEPYAFPPEPYLQTKQNLYRFAILMKKWKIIFKATNKLLIFIGIIHTARNPMEIKKLRTS